MMEYKKGMVVRATAGRDEGLFFAVTEADGEYVFIADGKTRKVGRPKKKNVKHIRATKRILEESGLTDGRLRKALSEYNNSEQVRDEGGSDFV